MRRLQLQRIFVPLLISGCLSAACADSFRHVEIMPLSTQDDELYVGHGLKVDLQFVNEKHDGPVEVFPEPPLTIIKKSDSSRCEIDGGIWPRSSVYLTFNEQVLLVEEYSGSNNQLVLYDTSTCKNLDKLDISDARWKISEDRLIVGRKCGDKAIASCRQLLSYRFNDHSRRLETGSRTER